MVKKKPQNDERLPLVDEITDNKTKTKYNGEKKEKENLDIETINNINENITLINSQINELATKINLISKEQIEKDIKYQIQTEMNAAKDNKLDKALKFSGIAATILVSAFAYYKTPSDLSIQNTINETYKNYKADTKEYINEQLQKQIEKIVDEKINNITLKK